MSDAAEPLFVGRQAELRAMREAFEGPTLGVLVRGPRGIGKTALLEQFRRDCAETAITVSFDVRDYVPAADIRNEDAVRHRLAQAVIEELSFVAPLPGSVRMHDVAEGTLFKEVLPFFSQRGTKRLVVMLDELEHLSAAVIRGVWRAFFRVRTLPSPPLFIGVLGETWGGDGADVLKDDDRFAQLRLGPLTRDDLSAMLSEGANGGALAPDAVDALHGETGGYPLFAAALLASLRHRRATSGTGVDLSRMDILEASAATAASIPQRVRHALAQAGPAAQRTLVSLVDHQAMTRTELLRAVETDWKATSEEVAASIEGLRRSGFVTERAGVLHVPVPMLVGWVKGLSIETIEADERPPAADAFAAFREAEERDIAGDCDGAITSASSAVSLDPKFWRSRWLLARLLFERARQHDSREQDLIEAEYHLRETAKFIPTRGNLAAQLDRRLAEVLIARAHGLPDGAIALQALGADIRRLDPNLLLPGARLAVARQEVDAWLRQLDQIPEDRWLDVTRHLLRHERCWQPVADRLTRWLDDIAEGRQPEERVRPVLIGVLRPLLEVELPEGAAPYFWRPLLAVLRTRLHNVAGKSPWLPVDVWEAILLSAPPDRLPDVLSACTSMLVADSGWAVRTGAGEARRLTSVLMSIGAVDVVRSSLDHVGTLVLESLEHHRSQPDSLIESLGAYLAPIVTGDVPVEARARALDIASMFFEIQRSSTGALLVTPEAFTGWHAFIAVDASAAARGFGSRLAAVAPQSDAPPTMTAIERQALEETLDQTVRIEGRIPLRIPGLSTSILDESVRAYRGSSTDGRQYLVRVFDLRGGTQDVLGLLRTLWDKERRNLATLTATVAGRALVRFVDARFDRTHDRAVLVTEWTGTGTLRDRLASDPDAFRDPSRRTQLWSHLAALIESVSALHESRFIHRAITPDVIYVGSDEDATGRLQPWLKLGHFEWSVYLRALSAMASPLARELNRYMPPEALRAAIGAGGGPTGESFGTDLYSLGLVLFECLVRSLGAGDLCTYRTPESYDEGEQQRHRDWVESLRNEVLEAARRQSKIELQPQERDVLLALLHFDLHRRPTALSGVLAMAKTLATAEARIAHALPVVTTLVPAADPGRDSNWVAHPLKRVMAEVDIAAPGELTRDRLAELLKHELRNATVHLNTSPDEFPLVLVSARSHIRFRVRPERGEHGTAVAFLEVARADDQPRDPPLARLTLGVIVMDVNEAALPSARRNARAGSGSSWGFLFDLAAAAKDSVLASALADRERVAFTDVLRQTVELERSTFARDIQYEIVGEYKVPRELPGTLIKAVDPGVNLAEYLAHASDEDPRFEIASRRTAPGRGTQVLLDSPALDFDTGWVTVPLAVDSMPAAGVIRSASTIAADLLYSRRRHVLNDVRGDTFLLDALVDPGGRTKKRSSGTTMRREGIIRDLDGDKLQLAQRFFEVEPLTVVQGPPATGKTTLATEILLRVLDGHANGRILITTHGHEPLDNLLERLVAEKRVNAHAARVLNEIEIVRNPSGFRKRDSGLAATFHPHARAEALFEQMREWCLREHDTLGLIGRAARALGKELAGFATAPHTLRARIEKSANLVFATINSRLVARPSEAPYDLVIVEEAARCYPMEVVGAMRHARRWLLIGDHHQLPPFGVTAMSKGFDTFVREARQLIDAGGFARVSPRTLAALESRFERYLALFGHLHDTPGDHRATLQTQWRMHPSLGTMVSEVFYKGTSVLNPADEDALEALKARRTHQFSAPPVLRNRQLIWIDMDHVTHVADCGEHRERGGLVENNLERRTIVGCLRQMRSPRMSKDVAILTPYRRQADLLIGLLREGINTFEAFGVLDDRVFTVDAFQGRQAGTVIISLVRNNTREDALGAIGFLSQPQRATVMCSRAERLLVIVGCMEQFLQFETAETGWVGKLRDHAEVVSWREFVTGDESLKARKRHERH